MCKEFGKVSGRLSKESVILGCKAEAGGSLSVRSALSTK